MIDGKDFTFWRGFERLGLFFFSGGSVVVLILGLVLFSIVFFFRRLLGRKSAGVDGYRYL